MHEIDLSGRHVSPIQGSHAGFHGKQVEVMLNQAL
jgi:hypothetical protein